jgi:RHS repeat-associated protein
MQLPNSSTVNFRYDPFGRRIQKAGASTTNYVYDGANVIEEVDQSGNRLARYSQDGGIDEPLSELRPGAISYYEQDGLGSVISLTNLGGGLGNTYVYDSFGNVTSSSGSLTNPFQYTGREYDAETGLRYYRLRYYDATVGRFASEDPIGSDGGVNFYSYVGNNPIAFTDPSGLAQTAADQTIQDLYNWFFGLRGRNNYHSNDAATESLSRSPAMRDIWKKFKRAGCKSDIYCGEFRLRDALRTLDPVIQSVGSFCAYVTNLGLGEVQIDAFRHTPGRDDEFHCRWHIESSPSPMLPICQKPCPPR